MKLSLIMLAKESLVCLRNALWDMVQYLRYSGTLSPYGGRLSFRAHIIKHLHALEKGLALPKPRTGFGLEKASDLLREISEYAMRFGADQCCHAGMRVLEEYIQFQGQRGFEHPGFSALCDSMRRLRRSYPEAEGVGGTREVRREDIIAASRVEFGAFVHSRYSARVFGSAPVPESVLREAVALAMRTPSVCNRQPWRVHVFRDPGSVARVLKHQSGNRGFGDQAPVVVVITCELGSFAGAHERHEAYVDGGMFAMTLVFALHAAGFGSCCLNLCQQGYEIERTRQATGIPASEVPIMMILVGSLPDRFRVACSDRLPPDEITVFHDAPGGAVALTPEGSASAVAAV